MIKGFWPRLRGAKLIFFLTFVGLGALFLTLGYLDYKNKMQQEEQVEVMSEEEAGLDVSVQDLQDLFSPQAGKNVAEYEMIVARNLFAPQRRPWAMSLSSEHDDVRQPRLKTDAFKLYGIISKGNERMALVYYRDLPSPDKYKLLKEGHTITREENGSHTAYTLTDIHDDFVTVQARGQVFQLNLFDERSDREKAQDIPDGTAEDSDFLVPGAGLEQLMQRLETDETRPEKPPSPQDMEKLVEEGKMYKIETPLGPVYRPVK